MKSSLTYEMHNYAAIALTRGPDEAKTAAEPRSEKYSLRQRQKRKTLGRSTITPEFCSDHDSITTNDKARVAAATATTAARSAPSNRTANVSRARSGRRPDATAAGTPTKGKTKSAPLSKYRRKTANARERTRMREINTAFETLKNCVPHAITGEDPGLTNEKLTKITTLRLAMKYIRILTEVLKNPTLEADFLLECKNDGDHRFTTEPVEHQPYVEEDPQSEEEPPAKKPQTKSSAKSTQGKSNTNFSRKVPAKRQTKKSQKNPPARSVPETSYSTSALYDILSPLSPLDSVLSAPYIPSSAIGVGASTATHLQHPITDLCALMLESDGESLHLSDRCLSPLQSGYAHLLDSSDMVDNTPPLSHSSNLHSDVTMSSLEENPLELSLRFLESPTDSLLYDHHQYPGGCISPLATLDTINPFSDMLHSDLSESGLALDYYLT